MAYRRLQVNSHHGVYGGTSEVVGNPTNKPSLLTSPVPTLTNGQPFVPLIPLVSFNHLSLPHYLTR